MSCLLFTYYFRNTGYPSAHHLEDRLPTLTAEGIDVRVISSLASMKASDLPQLRVPPILPGDLRFVLRMVARRKFPSRRLASLAWKLVFLPFFPLFLLERIIPLRDFTWSWCIPAGLCGLLWSLRRRPEVIYSFGGRYSAHLAAAIVSRLLGIPWVAQLQDPLIHGYAARSAFEEKFLLRVERVIMRDARRVVFMTDTARRTAESRSKVHDKGMVNYPGFDSRWFEDASYQPGKEMTILHVGSFGGTRSPKTFLEALEKAVREQPAMSGLVRFTILGNFGSETAPLLESFPFPDMIRVQGFVPRLEACRRMGRSDLLLLIQNREEISTETIPSKFYEYLFSGRPILGLLFRNDELAGLMAKWGHWAVELDDVEGIAARLVELFERWQRGSLPQGVRQGLPTTVDSGRRLAFVLRDAGGVLHPPALPDDGSDGEF